MLKFRALKTRSSRSLLLVMLMVGALTLSFQPTTSPDVAEAAPGDVRITGIVDGTINSGPKVVELFVEGTVDLSNFGISRNSNGNGFGSPVTLSGTYTDTFVYLIGTGYDDEFDSVFGSNTPFNNRIVNGIISHNGNDAYRIVRLSDNVVIDQVGSYLNTDPTNYEDSYMYRRDCTGPDGAWVPANWNIPGNNILDGLNAAQHRAAIPFGTFCKLVINEFNVSNTGTDQEFIEIYGVPNTAYSNIYLLGIEGDGTGAGVVDNALPLSFTTDANGLWVTGDNTNPPASQYLVSAFENGTLTLLLVEGFTGSAATDLDTNNDGILDSTPWTRTYDSVAVNDGDAGDLTYSNVVLGPFADGVDFGFGGGSRIPDGTDTNTTTDWVRNDFDGDGLPGFVSTATELEAVSTRGALNVRGTTDAPPVVISTSPTNGESGVPIDASIFVNFSEAIAFSAGGATIVCNSTNVTFASFIAATQLTLVPDTDFAESAVCTVTLVAANITDATNPSDLLDGDGNRTAGGDYSFGFQVAGPPVLPHIYDLQENGSRFGQVGPFTVEGVVTQDLQGASQQNGFFIQDVTGDGNTNTSDGIFVYDPSTLLNVNVGDIVQVTGTVQEYRGLTEIVATAIVDTGTDDTITPVVISLPIDPTDNFENYESMLVTVTGDSGVLTATDMYYLGRSGEITVSGTGRLFNPTNVYLPGSVEETNLRAENARNRLIIDDYTNQELDDFTPGNVPFIPNTNSQFRIGATIPSITGVLGYGPNGLSGPSEVVDYRVRPTVLVTNADWTQANPRQVVAPSVSGQITVASLNVENYFNGDGEDGNGDGLIDSGFPTARGAFTSVEFNRQSAKIVATICGLNADIAGLVELENEADAGRISAIETLVERLNAVPGCGPYHFISTGVIGDDEIKVGIIYKPAVVTPVGAFEILTEADDSRFDTSRNRPALAQTFDDANGGRFTLVVNHFKSKGSSCGAGDDSTNQGNCNGTRTDAAEALVDWLATDPTNSNDPDFLIVGDLNAYAQEDPIRTIEAGPDGNIIVGSGGNLSSITNPSSADDYVDLAQAFIGFGDVAYSYTFDGEAGYLDHAIANDTLASQVVGVAEWHVNSDEPDARGYDTRNPAYLYENGSNGTPPDPDPDNPFRSSDHDPIIIGLNLTRNSDVTISDTTIFRIGDWAETTIAGSTGGTALCASGLARLVVPFDGLSIDVTHVVQPGGGTYAVVIPGGTGVSPVDTNGTLGLATVTGSTTNNGRNVARVEVLSGTVCIDNFGLALNPANALANSPILRTTIGTLETGNTFGRASCVAGSARVQALVSYSTASASHEMSIVYVTAGETVLSQRFSFTTPALPPGTFFRFGFVYWAPVPPPFVPGYTAGLGAGSPLTTDTEVLVQMRNSATNACESVSFEYNCSTGAAIITQNSNTCIFN